MYLKTTEIRWFWPASDGEQLFAWFAGPESEAQAEERTDSYLELPECRTVGIKRREGRFEVKMLLNVEDSCTLSNGLRGRVQRWLKWSVEAVDLDSLLEEAGDWIEVHKLRRQRHFVLQDGDLREVPAEQQPGEASCRVELARVSAQGQAGEWFSLGFEADGVTERSGKALRGTLKNFFQNQPDFSAGAAEAAALSYPEWLLDLVR